MRIISFLFLTLFIASSHIFAASIIHPQVNDEKEAFPLDLLKLALSKSEPSMMFIPHKDGMTSDRSVAELTAGTLDVFWAGIIPEYEEKLLPIYIPVFKGMLGHRIFIIEKDKQYLFDDIKTLEDLKQLKAGQGTTWGDTLVLKNAGLPTVTTLQYHNLFPMLEGDRFDYFPRAIHEPWSEVESRPELNLTVEKNILLVYPFSMNFFVAKGNTELHDLIHEGLEMAIADGSFDELFYNSSLVKDALSKTKIEDRIVIRIPNPNMGPKTPLNRKEFWLKLDGI